MGQPTYILATDGSEPARAAEDYVKDNLNPDRVKILVVSVIEEFPPGILREGESLTAQSDTLQNELTETFREVAQDVRERLEESGFSAEVTMLAGDPGTEICEHATKAGVDGIIMGRRGHGEVRELLIGSVSQYVIHHVSMPVTIVPNKE